MAVDAEQTGASRGRSRGRICRPCRGYEWREIDGHFVLGVIATGLIADIIINVH